MAAKKAKGKGGRKSAGDGLDPVAQVAALRGRLSGLLDRLIAVEKALADALRDRDGVAPAAPRRKPATARPATAARKRTTAAARRPATRSRSTTPRGGA